MSWAPYLAATAGVLVLARWALSGGLSAGPSEHFTWAEVEASGTARELEIDNRITDSGHRAAAAALASVILELIRSQWGAVEITSWYRSPKLLAELRRKAAADQARGKTTPMPSPSSQHLRGEAADVKVQGASARQLAGWIRAAGLPVDQMIVYESSGHLHVSYAPDRDPRGQVLYQPSSGPIRVMALSELV